MKFLHVLPTLNAAAGGPIETVRQVAPVLQAGGHSVEVATLDDPRAPWASHDSFGVHALGPARGKYGYTPRLVPWLRENAAGYDAVIVRGIWQYHSFGTWCALRGRMPYYVFTHGMLDPWFKRTYPLKHLKKWLYWPWADYRVLRDAEAVLFTCEEERLSARQSFWLYRAREVVVNYGTALPPADAETQKRAFLDRFPQLAGKRLALFLSRLHIKKGCDLLVQGFAKVLAQDPAWHLVMAGPDPTGWTTELQAIAERLGIANRITWAGMLGGNCKFGAYRAAEVFVLPSHSENFGVVVAEALACGVPVLISDKVNIWREVQGMRAGVISNDDLAGLCQSLQIWLAMPQGEKDGMRRRAEQCFAKHFHIDRAAQSLVEVCQRAGMGNRAVAAALGVVR